LEPKNVSRHPGGDEASAFEQLERDFQEQNSGRGMGRMAGCARCLKIGHPKTKLVFQPTSLKQGPKMGVKGGKESCQVEHGMNIFFPCFVDVDESSTTEFRIIFELRFCPGPFFITFPLQQP